MQHPQESLLQAYTQGSLISPIATMVAAHLEVCDYCQTAYQQMLNSEAQDMEKGTHFLSQKEMDNSFEMLMNKVTTIKPETTMIRSEEAVKIEISGQIIQLPSAMNFLRDQKIPWKEFGKKNAIAPVSMGPEGNFYLIYIGPGESVPQHDHSGLEYSYVAAGSYDDGITTFNTGDFSVSGSGYSHSPTATSSDGCLVISWVEGRLNYFDGIFKPLNSLLWWYLHRA